MDSLDIFLSSEEYLSKLRAWNARSPQEKSLARGFTQTPVQVFFSFDSLPPSYDLPTPVRYHHIDFPDVLELKNTPNTLAPVSHSTDDKTPQTPSQTPIPSHVTSENHNPNLYYPDIRKKGAARKTILFLEVRNALNALQKSKGLDRKWEPIIVPESGIPDELLPKILKEEQDYLNYVHKLFPEYYS